MSAPKQEPARFDHARRVLAQMVMEAGEGNNIWTGNLTDLFKRVNLHVPAYTEVRKLLMACDAIRQVKRGGGGTPSVWSILKDELTLEDLWFAQGEVNKEAAKPEPVQQRYNDMNSRLKELERKMEELYAIVRGSSELSEV